MQRGRILEGFVIVEKFDKIKKKEKGAHFSTVTTNDSLGIILESADEDFAIGDQVYYMNKYETVFMGGVQVYVMKRDNIFKVIPGETDAKVQEK